MKILSIDFDNVLYDLESLNIKKVKEIYGVNMTAMDINNWNFYPDNYPLIRNIWGDWDQYNQGHFFEGDQDFIKELQKRFEIQIVTASYEAIENEKNELIFNRYGDIKVVHVRTGKAPHTKNSILVDDGLHNISDHVIINQQPAILVDREYGWNQGFQHDLVVRANNYQSIIDGIDSFCNTISLRNA